MPAPGDILELIRQARAGDELAAAELRGRSSH